MQQSAAMQRLTALRGGLALARRAVGPHSFPMRPMGGSKVSRTLCAAGPLPHQRGEGLPGTPPSRSLGTGRALPRAAAVDAPTSAQAPSNGGVAGAAAGAGLLGLGGAAREAEGLGAAAAREAEGLGAEARVAAERAFAYLRL